MKTNSKKKKSIVKKTEVNNEFPPTTLILQKNLERKKHTLSQLLNYNFKNEANKNMLLSYQQNTLIKKKSNQKSVTELHLNWSYKKTKIFSLQCFSFSSKSLVNLWKKKFLFQSSLNLKTLLVFPNSLNGQFLLKPFSQFSNILYAQKHPLTPNFLDKTFLPSRNFVRLKKQDSSLNTLKMVYGSTPRCLKNKKRTFLQINWIITPKPLTNCFPILKKKNLKLKELCLSFLHICFFFIYMLF